MLLLLSDEDLYIPHTDRTLAKKKTSDLWNVNVMSQSILYIHLTMDRRTNISWIWRHGISNFSRTSESKVKTQMLGSLKRQVASYLTPWKTLVLCTSQFCKVSLPLRSWNIVTVARPAVSSASRIETTANPNQALHDLSRFLRCG